MMLRRSLVGVGLAALLAVSVASPAFAYGRENWQTAFAGTAVTPGGSSFGFWGWCAFGGGVTSGNTADCEFAQYVHNSPFGSFTCHESLDITSWSVSPVTHDFVITGTARVTPSGLTAPCLSIFPGTPTSSFANVDAGIPAAAGHYSLANVLLGPDQVGEFQIQVTQIP